MKTLIAIEAIIRRRSIRKYDRNRPVEREKLETLVKAAMYAPSAKNLQPWHFIIVTDRALLDAIPSVHPHSTMIPEATAAILVCGDKKKEPNEHYLVQNSSAATQNILLEAYAEGLGTVWLGVYGREERMKGLAELFHLPDHILPVSLVAIGYPMEVKPVPERFRPECVHENGFGVAWGIGV